MKIRNGFVSNSSSSSFVLKFDEKYPDIVSIAESMLKNKFDEWADFDDVDDNDPFIKKVFDNIKKFKNSEHDPLTPIYFKSCNYDTYIVPITKDYVFIDTCNNTNWGVADDGHLMRELPSEILEKYPDSEGYGVTENYIVPSDELDEYGDKGNIKYNTEFFLIEEGIFMTSPNGYQRCKKENCYGDVWVIGSVEYCMTCDREKIMRGMKIKKIKNACTYNK